MSFLTTRDSSTAALARLQTARFDAIFTDLKMPDMDGYALLQTISKMNLKPAPLLIVVSSWVKVKSGLDDRKVPEAIDGHILKPFDGGEIKKVLSEAKAKQKR